MKLAYLADIYQHLNTLNTSMQGPKENILTSRDKLLAFKNKTQVFINTIQVEVLKCFHFQIQDRSDYKGGIPSIVSHLEPLTDSLDQHFPSLSSK
jgi:hypothetical protein